MKTPGLPGGLLVDGQLRRDFSFHPITGALERSVCESGDGVDNLAEQVTNILSSALHRVAGLPVSEERVRSLCSGDRQYLLLQLEARFDPAPKWLTSACQNCAELIQFQLIPGTLPVKPAGTDFPLAPLSLSIGDACIRVPTGADEESIAREAGDEQSALDLLLQRLVSVADKPLDIAALNAEDLELIDRTLDRMTPQAGVSVSIECPYCAHQQETGLDNYAWITRKTAALDEEIHTLAWRYHWSENDILALPRKRRKRYLQLIERSLGRYQADDFIGQMQGAAQ